MRRFKGRGRRDVTLAGRTFFMAPSFYHVFGFRGQRSEDMRLRQNFDFRIVVSHIVIKKCE